jgi:hypothetical protein
MPKMWRSRPRTTSTCEDGCSKVTIANGLLFTSTKTPAVLKIPCRPGRAHPIPQEYSRVHELRCAHRRLSWLFGQRGHPYRAGSAAGQLGHFGLGDCLQKSEVSTGKRESEDLPAWEESGRSSDALHLYQGGLQQGNCWISAREHLYQHQGYDLCTHALSVAPHLLPEQSLAIGIPHRTG